MTKEQARTRTTLIAAIVTIGATSCTQEVSPGQDPAAGHSTIESVAQVTELMQVTGKLIRSKLSGKCVDNPNGVTQDGIQYQSWACANSGAGNNNQRFHLWDQGGGRHDIRNVASNKCLWVLDGQNGRWVEQRPCNNQDSKQLWYLNDKGNNEWELRNVASGTCVDLAGASAADGAKIQGYACNNTAAQRFHIFNWATDFSDQFDFFDTNNWRDQTYWVNDEDQCYMANGEYNTRSVSNGMLTLRVRDLGYPISCNNYSKDGHKHWDTRYVGSRICSKNKKEFARGRWTARIRLSARGGGGWQQSSGQPGMFPAWWLLGERNNEQPIDNPSWENVCWPMTGSGEIDIFEHMGTSGPNVFTGRGVRSYGCGVADWQSYEVIGHPNLNGWGGPGPWYEYSVEQLGRDMYFTWDGNLMGVYPVANDYPERMFAILNYAKLSRDAMWGGSNQEWAMDVDWVKHEAAQY